MTPFGQAIREMRDERGITQRQMANDLGVSPAYLSALEHGHRSKPSWPFVQKVIGYFNIIWDDAEHILELAGLSDPRITIDTSGLSAQATQTANLMAKSIQTLSDDDLSNICQIIQAAQKAQKNSV
tara:strand:+ start:3762 stop:4139 length:378 start_codon:yes stop_codon:yes gene_type:complete